MLTPHDREFARFGFEVGRATGSARPAGWPPTWAASSCSRATPRSSPTPTGTAFVNGTGTPWLATAGTGDVLSGITGALLGDRPAARPRRRRSPRTCTAGPGSSPPSADRCSPATWSGGCPEAIGRVRGIPARRLGDSEA